MNLLVIFAIILATDAAAGEGSLARITGGDNAKRGDFPYQAGLRLSLYDGTIHHMCTGSVLNNEWILTAAHCTKNATSLIVFLGTDDIKNPEVTYTIDRADFITHSDFSWDTLTHDVAVIKIPFTAYSPNIQPIQFAKEDPVIGSEVVAVGWGKESDKTKEYATHLKWTTFKVISNEDCLKVIPLPLNDFSDKVCVATANGISICNGDSGGPMILKPSKLQVGVAAFVSKKGCTKNYPAGYTRVNKYLDWISNQTGIIF